MASQESKQRYLGRNRPPRVQITYDVEIGNAFETTELPLVVGILSDLSGNVAAAVPVPLAKRGFVDIDRDSFDTVLERIKPTLKLNVKNVLDDATEAEKKSGMSVSLTFESFEDFSPQRLVANVEGLKALYDKRQKLQDLLIKLDGNAELITKSEGLADAATLKAFQNDLKLALAPPPPLSLTDQTASTATVTAPVAGDGTGASGASGSAGTTDHTATPVAGDGTDASGSADTTGTPKPPKA